MVWLGWAWLSGCDKLKLPPSAEACAPVCAAATPTAPTTPAPGTPAPPSEFEKKILDSVLEDVHKGIQPWNDTAIGICKGRKDCDKFLGVSPGALGRGAHFVKAELKVPPGPPGTWKVKFQTTCTTPAGKSGRSSASTTCPTPARTSRSGSGRCARSAARRRRGRSPACGP